MPNLPLLWSPLVTLLSYLDVANQQPTTRRPLWWIHRGTTITGMTMTTMRTTTGMTITRTTIMDTITIMDMITGTTMAMPR
ncbi:hypothetical protein RMSM_07709 [Rhodopirellula maiorica SM1]|uniref:Uncharacterized protein n=1 Tax=Rhodopirellula maiorica SM1 TaxID=1265738 RepID=M5R7M1_9BACT|nr:hypothetical protein RMSM_07709 [Rhodopirellula maiorica SM1]